MEEAINHFTSLHFTSSKQKKNNFSFLFDFVSFHLWNEMELNNIITVIWRQYSCCMFMEWKNFEFLNGMINGIAMLTATALGHSTPSFLQFSLPNGKIDWNEESWRPFSAPRRNQHKSIISWREIDWICLLIEGRSGALCLVGWMNLGGLWAAGRQWLRPKKRTQPNTKQKEWNERTKQKANQ